MATGVLYGRIHFNISLQRSKSSANTTPTHALHILQTSGPLLQEPEEYSALNLKRL